MLKVTSMRLSQDNIEWCNLWLQEYKFSSLGNLIDSIMYVAKTGCNPPRSNSDAIGFMQAAISGELKDKKILEASKIEQDTKIKFLQFMNEFELMESVYDLILTTTDSKIIQRYENMEKTICKEFCEQTDIALYPTEYKELIILFIDEIKKSKGLREYRKAQLMRV